MNQVPADSKVRIAHDKATAFADEQVAKMARELILEGTPATPWESLSQEDRERWIRGVRSANSKWLDFFCDEVEKP